MGDAGRGRGGAVSSIASAMALRLLMRSYLRGRGLYFAWVDITIRRGYRRGAGDGVRRRAVWRRVGRL